MKKIWLLFITFGLIAFMHGMLLYGKHEMLLYGKAVSLYDFNNPLVLKSLGISTFSILLIVVLLRFHNRRKKSKCTHPSFRSFYLKFCPHFKKRDFHFKSSKCLRNDFFTLNQVHVHLIQRRYWPLAKAIFT